MIRVPIAANAKEPEKEICVNRENYRFDEKTQQHIITKDGCTYIWNPGKNVWERNFVVA